MAATWRLLPTTRFRSPKLQKEIICDQILCDFGRLIEADEEQFIQGFHVKELLFTTVALYGKNLSEMTSESLFPVLTKKSVKTLVLLEKYGEKKATNSLTDDDIQPGNNDKYCKSAEQNEDIDCDGVKKEPEDETGEFDDIFSDSSENDDDSSEQSDDVIDFSEEFKCFVAKIKRKQSQVEKDSGQDPSIVKLIIGAVTYDRSYRVPNETTVHIHLLAVRKKFRNCGIGTSLIEKMKDPDLVGPYDAIVTYADPDAVTFFANKDFTDDAVLNTRYRSKRQELLELSLEKVDDNWLNSTPMCYIPPFVSRSSLTHSVGLKDASIDIKELEHRLKEWKTLQTNCYQNQMMCTISVIKRLKILTKTVDSQSKIIQKLKKENLQLRARLKQNGNCCEEETEESRLVYEFVEQLMLEKNIFNVEVNRIKKASVGRERFYSRLESLRDPLMFTELYYCGGASIEELETLMENGFSEKDFTAGCFGRGLYFSQSPRKAMEFTVPGSILVCLVGLGNTYSLAKVDPPRTKPPEGCDSVLTIGRQSTGSQYVSGQEFVIYDKNQAVPIYLLDMEVDWSTQFYQ